ncbi:hypothetical protein ff3pr_02334 [Weissella cibaria]|uniref:Uncharacterized protein n=1 Tax=Weissella cibaria TaxID=137591 RepID=A0A0D1LLE3_9LACO|nr:hypothetical protein QX99_01958 [Weissella cibaria]KIU19477.1 hypothetical protein ff3pr_02334 [Weissella cibaria]
MLFMADNVAFNRFAHSGSNNHRAIIYTSLRLTVQDIS